MTAAVAKEVVQPKRAAIHGVREAVTAPPICPAHIHGAREEGGAGAGEIDGDGPEGALREIEGAGAAGEDESGEGWAGDLRADNEEDGGDGEGGGGEDGAADEEAAGAGEAVAEGAAEEAADGHGEEGEHGVAGAGFEIEAADLGHVEEEPAEEDPGDVAEGEVGGDEGGEVAAGEEGSPGEAWGGGVCGESGVDEGELCGADAGVLVGGIAGEDEPGEADREADDGAEPEGGAPAVVGDEPG